ncbi:MAG TPA: hypothetical protein VN702_23620, partial [Acetobacteraceae bacterium]|nr:hypothetical protein [Acetobacteraceae bacterium]
MFLRRVIVFGIIGRRRFLPCGALHPGRRTGGRRVIGLDRRKIGFALWRARLHRLIGAAADIRKRIGLADQARQFG